MKSLILNSLPLFSTFALPTPQRNRGDKNRNADEGPGAVPPQHVHQKLQSVALKLKVLTFSAA